jgi:hypothetical protein
MTPGGVYLGVCEGGWFDRVAVAPSTTLAVLEDDPAACRPGVRVTAPESLDELAAPDQATKRELPG